MIAPVDLTRLFSPRGIAVIGASESARGVGGQPMHFLTGYGYVGAVYPVNPKRETVLGLRCFASVLEIPGECDVALIALPAHLVPGIIRECGQRGVRFAVVLSSGFREVGPEGAAIEAELILAGKEAGVRIVGPNCMGVLNIPEKIHNGFGQGFRVNDYRVGPIAMATQSGGYGFTLLRNASRAGIGFNQVVSVGNSVDLTSLDFIAHFLESDEVRIVSAFIEGIADGRRLIALGRRALEVGKPILVWKVGNTTVGQKAAASHTASLASSYDLYQAAFREGGFIELEDYEDLVDVAKAFLCGVLPAGNRVGLVSGSGGAGVIAADRFSAAGLQLPAFAAETQARMREIFPPLARTNNPIDLSGENTKDGQSLSNAAAEIALADPGIDMVMVRSGQSTGSPEAAQALVDIRNAAGKPVLVATVAEDHQPAKTLLDAANVPWFLTVGRAATAARALADFAVRKLRYSAKVASPPARPFPRPVISLPIGERFLSEADSRAVLAAYGLPMTAQVHLATNEIGNADLSALKFPVAVKINSPDLPHKSDADAIRLGLRDRTAVTAAAREVLSNAARHDPAARLDGVLVQEMASGTEFIFGAISDVCFGPVVVFGSGGIFAEVMADVTHGFAPLEPGRALAMLEQIRGTRLLQGYRGRPPADLAALADFAERLGWLIADHADQIESIDINPVFVDGHIIKAADALIVLREEG